MKKHIFVAALLFSFVPSFAFAQFGVVNVQQTPNNLIQRPMTISSNDVCPAQILVYGNITTYGQSVAQGLVIKYFLDDPGQSQPNPPTATISGGSYTIQLGFPSPLLPGQHSLSILASAGGTFTPVPTFTFIVSADSSIKTCGSQQLSTGGSPIQTSSPITIGYFRAIAKGIIHAEVDNVVDNSNGIPKVIFPALPKVAYGEPIRFEWSASGATSCTFQSGSQVPDPNNLHRYLSTSIYKTGLATDAVTINYARPDDEYIITANTTIIGASRTIELSCTNGDDSKTTRAKLLIGVADRNPSARYSPILPATLPAGYSFVTLDSAGGAVPTLPQSTQSVAAPSTLPAAVSTPTPIPAVAHSPEISLTLVLNGATTVVNWSSDPALYSSCLIKSSSDDGSTWSNWVSGGPTGSTGAALPADGKKYAAQATCTTPSGSTKVSNIVERETAVTVAPAPPATASSPIQPTTTSSLTPPSHLITTSPAPAIIQSSPAPAGGAAYYCSSDFANDPAAIGEFQCAQGILGSATCQSPATSDTVQATGYGNLGPITRARLNSIYGDGCSTSFVGITQGTQTSVISQPSVPSPTVTPTTVTNVNTPVTISWGAANASSCTIQSNLNALNDETQWTYLTSGGANGTATIYPTAGTWYVRAVCRNASGGTATSTATQHAVLGGVPPTTTVQPTQTATATVLPTISLTQNPATATTVNDPITIGWTLSDPRTMALSSCNIQARMNGGVWGLIASGWIIGGMTLSPPITAGNWEVRAVCTGPGGTATSTDAQVLKHTISATAVTATSVTTTTTLQRPTVPSPTVTPTTVTNVNTPVTISWGAANASSCTIQSNLNALNDETQWTYLTSGGANGTATIYPTAGTWYVRAVCRNASGGTATSTATQHAVLGGVPPTTTTAQSPSVSQPTVLPITTTNVNSPVTINWTATNAASCTIQSNLNNPNNETVWTYLTSGGSSGSTSISPTIAGTWWVREVCKSSSGLTATSSPFSHVVSSTTTTAPVTTSTTNSTTQSNVTLPVVTLTQGSSSSASGDTVNVSWSTDNPSLISSCMAKSSTDNANWSNWASGTGSGAASVVLTTGTYYAKVFCTTTSGASVESNLVTHTVTAAAAPLPSISLTCGWVSGGVSHTCAESTATSASGDTVNVSWIASNANSCTIETNVNGGAWTYWTSGGASGAASAVLPIGAYQVRATCAGAGGTANTTISHSVALNTSGSQTASVFNAFGNAASTVAPSHGFAYAWDRNLQVGSPYSADVAALQTALLREGVYTGEVTGGFYAETLRGVQNFQQKYGIETTGFVGPLTRAKLNALY